MAQLQQAARDGLGGLGAAPALINDQADRACFAAGLIAANAARSPCLLPASGAQDQLADLQGLYPGARELQLSKLSFEPGPAIADATWHDLPRAVICFTSGSTGEPQPVEKSWQALHGAVSGMARAAGWQAGETQIVATVPPQHMYGLEMSVLSALFCGCRVFTGKPFFPQDVADALALLDGPGVLVSTPLHLRALLKSGVALPAIRQIVSATAPLDPALAGELEAHTGAQLLEVYGSTETGAIATRRTAQSSVWTLFAGARLDAESDTVLAPHLPLGTTLQDDIECLDERRFHLLGRPQNMLKVAGKRYSLDALTHQLQALPEVEDAVALVLPGSDRPAALVVSSCEDLGLLRQQLAQHIDAVFLPRPLRRVERIPRNATGKLQRREILKLFE